MEKIYLTHYKSQINIMWFGQAILMAVMVMSLPYWPLYIKSLNLYSPTEIRYWSAAIYLAPFITSFLSSPIWGKLSDTYGYKSMVLRACLGLFITQALIMLFTDVKWIFIFRLLQGILAGFIIAAQSWALAISPEQMRGEIIGKLQSATAVGNLFGPLAGGIIATYLGYNSIFIISTISSGCIFILFYYLLINPEYQHLKFDKKIPPKLETKLLTPLQPVLFFLLIITLIQIARSTVTPFFSLFVNEKLGGNDIVVGILYAVTGLMIFIFSPFWGKLFDRLLDKKVSALCIISTLLFAACLTQALNAITQSFATVFILRLLWGICLSALLPIFLKLIVDLSKTNQHGYYLGLGNSATKLGNLIGIIIGSLLESNFGFNCSFLFISSIYFICGTLLLIHTYFIYSSQHKELSFEK